MTSSISTTLDNIISVNMLPDTALDKIKESLYKDKKAEKTEKSEPEIDEEEVAVSSESDETEDVETTQEEDAYTRLFEMDYSREEASFEIGNYIKRYTAAVSNFLTYQSENKVPLDESPLKDVLKNKFKTYISRSAYNDVGMGEYYNLNKMLKMSQSLSSSNNGVKINSDIIKNFTNFAISV